MRYTRYNYKKNSSKAVKNLGYFLTIIIIALSIGTVTAKLVFSTDGLNLFKNADSGSSVNGSSNIYGSYEIIQCGFYSKESNAMEIKNKIQNKIPVYIVKDKEKFRVIAGIYPSGKGDDMKNSVVALGVNAVKIKIYIKGTDYYDAAVSQIVDGYLKMISSINDSGVKSVNTDEFKEWVSAFEEKGAKADDIKAIKTHISNLPQEMTKDKVQGEMEFLDSLLEKYKV